MKKITIILFSILFLMKSAQAESFYSNYSYYSDYTENYVESSDTTLVQSERRYKIYNEQELKGDYYIEGENPNTFPIIDKNNFIQTEYSLWDKNKPAEKSNRDILEKTVYEYRNMKKFRYIHIHSVRGSYGEFRVREIEIYNNGEKIPFTYTCDGCSDSGNTINDGILTSELFLNNGSGLITIDLNGYYDLANISIKIYLYDSGDTVKEYALKYTYEEDFESSALAEGFFQATFKSEHIHNIFTFKKTIDNYDIISPEWEEPILSEEEVLETKTRKVTKYQMYSYRDLKYYYFNIEKVYADGYYLTSNETYPFLDNNIYQDFYRFKTRDKVVISDDLRITSYDTKLSDFILESTISDIVINGDVDYNQNGLYSVTFELPFETVEKEVRVSILENDLNPLLKELEEKQNQLDKVLLNNEETQKELNECLLKIKENEQLIETYEEQIKTLSENVSTDKELNKQINSLTKEKEKLEKQVTSLNEKIDKLNQKIDDNKELVNELNNKIKEYKALEKSLNKENKELITKQQEYENKISTMESLINDLQKQNEEQLKKLEDKTLDELTSKVNIVYDNQNQTINKLLNQIDLLNTKISNQNNSIDLLIKYNNDNADKYKNEVERLQILLNEEQNKTHLKNDELNVCLNDEKSIISKYDKTKKQMKQNQVLFYIILLLIIIFSMFTLKKINKKF